MDTLIWIKTEYKSLILKSSPKLWLYYETI